MEPENLAPENVQPDPGARGLIARHRIVAVVMSLFLLLGAVAYLTWFYWPEPDRSPPIFAWYTIDDGKSWFQDDAERIPPFEHTGKPAVRLHLFSRDDAKTTFVGYLQKLPEEVFKKYREKGIDPAKVDDDELAADSGWLMKRAGEADWVSSKDGGPKYLAVVTVHCPEGRSGTPGEVFPPNPKKR